MPLFDSTPVQYHSLEVVFGGHKPVEWVHEGPHIEASDGQFDAVAILLAELGALQLDDEVVGADVKVR